MRFDQVQITNEEEAALVSLYRTLQEYVLGDKLQVKQMEPSDFMLIHRDVDAARHCLRAIFQRVGNE